MATKRKRTRESKSAAPATDAAKPEASGRIAPRKRTGAPAEREGGNAPDASGESARERRERRGTAPKPRKRRWPLVVAGSLLLVVLLAVGGFSWDRWLRYDDAREFQGAWQTHGTTAVVVVDGESIKLTEDVSWAYTLDTGAKTLTYSFGNMEGSGRYRFSLDRSQLVIVDGDGYSWFSTLVDDIGWQFDQLKRAIQGRPQEKPPSGDKYTVLDRLSHDAAATPQTGTPVEPAPEPAPEPEPTTEPEPEAAPESADAGGDADAGSDDASSNSPSGVFDVSDLPA